MHLKVDIYLVIGHKDRLGEKEENRENEKVACL